MACSKLMVDACTMLEILEFEESSFYRTFKPPENAGITIVGENGRKVDSSPLYDLWARGREQPSLCT